MDAAMSICCAKRITDFLGGVSNPALNSVLPQCVFSAAALSWMEPNEQIHFIYCVLLSYLEQAHHKIFCWIMTVTVATIMYVSKEHMMLLGNLYMIHKWPKAADLEWCNNMPLWKVTRNCWHFNCPVYVCTRKHMTPKHHAQLQTASNKLYSTHKTIIVDLIHIHPPPPVSYTNLFPPNGKTLSQYLNALNSQMGKQCPVMPFHF